MTKLSKSELTTPEFEARARAAAAHLSEHRMSCWDIGETVWHAGRRGEIIDAYARIEIITRARTDYLTVRFEDGTIETLVPLALNR